ncbi:unnamed protein product [Rotaria magnacalcarata]|uniref:Uncharacterized protein n=9 Tax=Rotaria magnacalcarata TaxID=392030 RepID=A0A815U711_9BILA|nr:unnamed protein product [Rotaria magnacalcarata]CAF1627945.1 unnamed protein product [Rotaria magnacalcarata]
MDESQDVPDTIFSSSPLRKLVHFNEKDSIPQQLTTSTSLLTSSSTIPLSFPLVSQKPGVRFKLFCLFLCLITALAIGFILSLLFITQIIRTPKSNFLSYRFFSKSSERNAINNQIHLFEHVNPLWINELDLSADICNDFYGCICRKWLSNHPLSPLELKRSWLTERSQNIREAFAEKLANLSEIEAYNYQMKADKNNTQESVEDTTLNYFDGSLSDKNELEYFYSSHDEYENEKHKLVKRESTINSQNLSQSTSNMLLYYRQCIHTSESVLIDDLKRLAYDRFWFTNNYEIISTRNHLHFLFEQMIEHPLMGIWNVNTINLGTLIIIHIQRKIHDQQKFLLLHQIEQAGIFEHYVQKNHIDLCYQSARVGPLANTLKEYNDLLSSTLVSSESSINDDLHSLISKRDPLPIVYSSVRRPNDLRDLIQFMLDKDMIQSLNNTDTYDLFLNFTHDLEQYLLHTPIFRSTISSQCQLFLNYYIRIRSLNETKIETWLDYISSSIIHLILHSWPGDASYTCLYSTIVRHNQFEIIPYWHTFIEYTKSQIKDISTPIITVEIRLVDFFQLDSIFRFLFADQFAHYCNLMVYKYGPKLLPFVSTFHEGIQISLKSLWKQVLQENFNEQINVHSLLLPSNLVSHDCLTLLEYYYPYTLSSFYEHYMSNKTEQLYVVADELRNLLVNNSDNELLSSIKFHIKPERLKLFDELSTTKSHIPYEYYLIEDNYLSTAWNIIENLQEQVFQPSHTFFELNGHHTIEHGIFLQPTVAELYSNETTRQAALLLIAHELGHALCPCGINQTEREYYADLIALHLIIDYNEQQWNRTLTPMDLKTFFITYVQSECMHINHEIVSLMNKQKYFIELHINRVLQENDEFQTIFNCSSNQDRPTRKMSSLLLQLCATCRKVKH